MEWRLYPLDVLFFRGPEPMNAGESGIVHPVFPPAPEVTQGFVRARVLEALGVSFAAYRSAVNGAGGGDAAGEAVALIGRPGGDPGQLHIRGPYLVVERGNGIERWYPAPLDLRRAGDDGDWRPGAPGGAVTSDLGPVRFLDAPEKDLERKARWISHTGLEAYLRGEAVPSDHVQPADAFHEEEARVGIGRDRLTRVAAESMLYAPSFVRLRVKGAPAARAGIGLRVTGIDDGLQRRCAGVSRLGGEGRMVEVEVCPDPPVHRSDTRGETMRLVSLTPVRWGGGWLPPGFTRDGDGWSGAFGGVAATVVSAVVGKPVRIGGWDIVQTRPKPAAACVPAGSVYFLRVDGAGVPLPLHDQTFGDGARAGFGHVLAGRWMEGGAT